MCVSTFRPDQRVDRAEDKAIRLSWREKLVEVGLHMGLVMSGLLITVVVYFGLLIIAYDAVDTIVPGFWVDSSLKLLALAIVSACIGNTCAFCCFPYLIRLIFRGYELRDVRLDRSVRKLVTATGMNIMAEKLYAIKGKTANAVVSGLFRKSRHVFFTNKILEKMTEEEIIAIFAHELAHAKHRHIPKMLFAVMLWICAFQTFMYLIGFNQYFNEIAESVKMWVAGLITYLHVLLMMFLVLFPLSRRNEYEADATAATWVGVECYKSALHRLYQLNDKLKPPPGYSKVLQTHPTLQNRLDRLSRLDSK